MNNLNGFVCNIDFSDNKMAYDIHHDGFSVYTYEDNKLHVCVQTSIKFRDEASWLASEYKKSIGEFIPPRDIHGSFVIIDKYKKMLVCGRDRSQAYHMYYAIKGRRILISTDIRTFLDEYKVLDAVAIDLAIMKNYTMAQFPVIKGVKVLLPGRCIICDSKLEMKEKTFWKINHVEVPESYEEAVNYYAKLLMDSISSNVSNDTASVYLSGGSDSAAVMGALNKLGVGNVHAVHISIKGNYQFEDDDVNCLHDKYKFNLKFVTPNYKNTSEWREYVNKMMFEGSIHSIYISFPTNHLMGSYLSQVVPKGTTVFNGEMCLLDVGFSESGDTTRGSRRWLFVEGGRSLGYSLKIVPDFVKVNWDNNRRPYFIRQNFGDKLFVLNTSLRSFLHSIGRPLDYFGGMKLGYNGFPGIFLGLSLLPNGYKSNAVSRSKEFFNVFVDDLCSKDWKTAMSTMVSCWYSEASNFTMLSDVASYGGVTMCFPFSSVELMDYASSLPIE